MCSRCEVLGSGKPDGLCWRCRAVLVKNPGAGEHGVRSTPKRLTDEERTARQERGRNQATSEERADRARRLHASRTPEERSAYAAMGAAGLRKRKSNPAAISKQAESLRRYWQTVPPEERKRRAAHMYSAASDGRMTRPEIAVAAVLNFLGVNYEANAVVDTYCVDFLLPGNLILEVDGARWHDADKDALRDERLRGLGYTVVRVPAENVTHLF